MDESDVLTSEGHAIFEIRPGEMISEIPGNIKSRTPRDMNPEFPGYKIPAYEYECPRDMKFRIPGI
jgi:hypothetical protein